MISPTPETKQLFTTCSTSKIDTASNTFCEAHYQLLYRKIHYSPCACCEAKPKPRIGPYTRHSPDATTVSLHLKNTTGFNFDIQPADTICKTCYDMHSIVLKDIENKSEIQSSLQLQSDIAMWTATLEDHNVKDNLTIATLKTVIFVATKLLQNKAILLPQAASVFV